MTVRLRPLLIDAGVQQTFDYLVDPHNRSAWQSSLRRVRDVRGPVGEGQVWIDVTVAGVRPHMQTTVYAPPTSTRAHARWTERGEWKAYAAELTLDFTPVARGCEVSGTLDLDGPGAGLLRRAAPLAVRSDLRRAARIIATAARADGSR